MTVEEMRTLNATLPPDVHFVERVAEVEGEIVASGWALQKFWVDRAGSYRLEVVVLPRYQRRGIGGALYEELLAAVREREAQRLYVEVQENRSEAMRFVEERGFTPTGFVTRMSRLAVAEANLEGYEGLEERLGSEGIRVTTLQELGAEDESVWHAHHELHLSTTKDEPGSETFTLGFEQFREHVSKEPGMVPESIFIALHGDTQIGYAKLRRQGEDAAWNQGTGVESAYRGRGVARLLKLHTLRYARQHGIAYLYTGNDLSNSRMLAINIRLGYQALPNSIETVKELTAEA